jgi:hypothetical protein
MVSLIRGPHLTLCSAILLPLEPPLLFCRARAQRAVGHVAVPYAVGMIAMFVRAAEQHGRAVSGDRPAAMMLAQVEETDRIGDGFPGQIDRFWRCRLRTQNKPS